MTKSVEESLYELAGISDYLYESGLPNIAEEIDDEIVNLRNKFRQMSENKYKEDAEKWGSALNEASWKFVDTCPEKSVLLFNTCKTSLREAILCYLNSVEKQCE